MNDTKALSFDRYLAHLSPSSPFALRAIFSINLLAGSSTRPFEMLL
jgi:hypothetical protein